MARSSSNYIRLGKALGVMLSDKKYNWIKYFDRLIEYLDTVFPPINETSLEIRNQEIRHLLSQMNQAREEFNGLRFTAAAAVKI